jgi:hypothetical protein
LVHVLTLGFVIFFLIPVAVSAILYLMDDRVANSISCANRAGPAACGRRPSRKRIVRHGGAVQLRIRRDGGAVFKYLRWPCRWPVREGGASLLESSNQFDNRPSRCKRDASSGRLPVSFRNCEPGQRLSGARVGSATSGMRKAGQQIPDVFPVAKFRASVIVGRFGSGRRHDQVDVEVGTHSKDR